MMPGLGSILMSTILVLLKGRNTRFFSDVEIIMNPAILTPFRASLVFEHLAQCYY